MQCIKQEEQKQEQKRHILAAVAGAVTRTRPAGFGLDDGAFERI